MTLTTSYSTNDQIGLGDSDGVGFFLHQLKISTVITCNDVWR